MLTDTDITARRLVLAGCLLTIFGAKIALIAMYGSPTPFWDQWDAEAALLYRPYFTGTLQFGDLFLPHNEHRLLLSRLAALGLLIVTGRWDPIVQMLVNASFYAGTIGVLLVTLFRGLDRTGPIVLSIFAMMLCSVPLTWENTLFGLLQFYFLILFGPLALYLLYGSAAFSQRWWAGSVAAVLGFFCLASGALTLLAFVGLVAMQFTLRMRSGRKELAGMAVQLAIVTFLIWLTPTVKGHQELKAQSLLEWLNAFVLLLSWPLTPFHMRTYLSWLGAVIVFAPVIAVAVYVWRERAPLTDSRWYLLALGVWVCGQMFAFSYGRSHAAYVTSRYMDIYEVGLLVNLACLLRLTLVDLNDRFRLMLPLAVTWLVLLCVAGGLRTFAAAPAEMAMRRDMGALQTEAVKHYMRTGDAAALQNKPQFHIPHPLAERLIELLSEPSIRAILSPVLLDAQNPRSLKATITKHGWRLIPFGLALLLGGLVAAGLGTGRVCKR